VAEARVVGLGRLTLSRRERMVMVEPSGIGMALFTLRAASDVRAPQFGSAEGDLDAEMVAIAGAIISQRTGHFDPSTYRDRYQEALTKMRTRRNQPFACHARRERWGISYCVVVSSPWWRPCRGSAAKRTLPPGHRF